MKQVKYERERRIETMAGVFTILIGIFISRQNSDYRGTVSNKNLGAGARGDVCSSGAHLHLHDLLLLHEEVANTSQNDALRNEKGFIRRTLS